MKWFDYVFYRVARFYFKWDKRHGFTAICYVTLVQILLICDVLGLIASPFVPRSESQHYVVLSKNLGIIACLVILAFNYWRYYGKYFKYKKVWANESASDFRNRGYLVVFSMILAWVPIILMGVLR